MLSTAGEPRELTADHRSLDMRAFTTATLHRVFPPLAFSTLTAIAACGSQVETPPAASSAGTGGSTSSNAATTTANSSSTSTSATTSTSTSVGGGGPVPLTCAPGESALVAGSSKAESTVAVLNQGLWIATPDVVPAEAESGAYTDFDSQLAVLWVGSQDGVSQTHITRTKDGAAFTTHDVHNWNLNASTLLIRARDDIFVGHDSENISVAGYDFEKVEWNERGSTPTPFLASSAVTLLGPSDMVVVGLKSAAEPVLCEMTFDFALGWGASKCHPELGGPPSQGSSPLLPQIVALPNGDAVAVYFTSYVELSAAVLHAGQWSAPITTTLPDAGNSFAVTTTRAGEVLAGLVLTSREVVALRFSPATGWTAPIAIDTGARQQQPSAAPGICGADALLAYGVGGAGDDPYAVRVARIHEAAAESSTIAVLAKGADVRLSLATRTNEPSL